MNISNEVAATDEELEERMVTMTRDLILIPGSSQRPEDLKRALKWVGNRLETIEGTEVTYYEHNGVWSLVAKPRGFEIPEVMMCSHVDVVHHADEDVYTSHIEDGRIWGPGSGDMKANVVMTMNVYRRIQRENPGAPIAVAVTTDEEIGGMNGMGYLFGEAGVRCKLAMVPDGGSIDRIVTKEKGIMQMKVSAKGAAGHASRPWLSSNAMEKLIEGLQNVKQRFSERFPASDDHWHATCVVTIISTDNKTSNRIPDYAEANLDIRFPAPMTAKEMEGFMLGILDEGIEGEVIVSAESTELNPDPLYYQVTEEMLGYEPEEEQSDGTSDARFIAKHGIPVVITRPLCGSLHDVDEWVKIESLMSLYHIYTAYIRKKLALIETKKAQ